MCLFFVKKKRKKLSHKMLRLLLVPTCRQAKLLNSFMSHPMTGSIFFLFSSQALFLTIYFYAISTHNKISKNSNALVALLTGPYTSSPSGRRWSTLDILNSVQDPCFIAGVATAAYHIMYFVWHIYSSPSVLSQHLIIPYLTQLMPISNLSCIK